MINLKRNYLTLMAIIAFAALFCGASPVLAQVSLGEAQSFGVLAATTVTNTGPTAIIGDLGVWPGTSITGFPPGTVTGTQYPGVGSKVEQAKADIQTAYNALKAMPFDVDLTGQDLGGMTLSPGVYSFSSSAFLTGTLTLNAQGDPNALFVFQMGSTLITASNAVVTVINSASTNNVYWQVGSSATMGTGTAFAGHILAHTSITATTGASISGSFLALGGAVTLDNNRITANGVTAVELISFQALQYDQGTMLEWQTGFEADNLGFNIYRQEAGIRHLVNPQLIAGSALTTGLRTVLQAGQAYVWWDKTPAKDASYWLEDIDLNGFSTFHGPFCVQAAAHQQAGKASTSSPAKLLEQLNDQTSQSEALNVLEKTASLTLPARASAAQNLAQASVTTQQAVKISVKQEGWYRVSQPELVGAGLDANCNPSLLQLSVDGRQLPIKVLTNADGRFDETSAIEFYGLGLNTPSTDTRTYWLSVASTAGLRIAEVKAEASPSARTSFVTTVERKDRTIYFSSLRNGEKENFFGAVVAGAPVNQELRLMNLDVTASKQAELEIALQGVTLVQHRVAVRINGFVVGEVIFSGQQAGLSKFAIQHSLLREGTNTVQLVSLSSPSDVNLVDYLRLTYQHSFVADDDVLKLSVTGQERVTIDGFSKKEIRVFDVTEEGSVKELLGEINESRNGYSITVASNNVAAKGDGQYTLIGLTDDKAKIAASIKMNLPSSWRSPSQAADFVILTTKEFLPALEALKMVRESEGYTIALVDIEDVYDEYSFGQKSPQAVKDFLVFAKSNWKIAPSYLLLAGDASYDAKNYLGRGEYDFVPTKLIDTNYMETASDDWFADFNNDGLSELAVGRLPMRTLAEGQVLINKLVSYAKSAESESVLLVSDATDGYNFEQASSRLRGVLPGSLEVTEVKRGQVDASTAKQQLLEALNRGQKLVNYTGHGSVNLWRGNLLTSEEAKGLSNKEHLPMFVMMTCLNGYFQDPLVDSLGESLLKAENGGAIAVWASTGLSEPDKQGVLNEQFYRLLFDPRLKGLSIGDATRRAKAAISDADIRRTWILLGDPTLRLR